MVGAIFEIRRRKSLRTLHSPSTVSRCIHGAKMADEVDESSIVSLNDILEEEDRLEADANAVLGGSNDKECTFNEGYVKRQALYACSTCTTTDPAGICLACSLTCHNGHDLYELYTKRNFRCDCGTGKFPDAPCKLSPKDCINGKNKYNQNFRGLYCTCHRPYPDEEDDVEDEMIQCIICEDWYHGRHLGRSVETNYEEMICQQCVKEHKFLMAYSVFEGDTTVIKKEEEEGDMDKSALDVEGEDTGETNASKAVKEEAKEEVKIEATDSASSSDSAPSSDSAEEAKTDVKMESPTSSSLPSDNSLQAEDLEQPGTSSGSSSSSQSSCEGSGCVYQQLSARTAEAEPVTLFMPSNWRSKLCQCSTCLAMYVEQGVLYLADEEDTMMAYEKRGEDKNPPRSDNEVVMDALSSLNHVQKMEVINGFNDLKTNLMEYFRKFAENGKVVCEEDVQEFFQDMKNKRKRTQAPQWYCK